MPIPTYKHLARADMIARHRKQFLGGLIASVLIGAFGGYHSGFFFAQFLTTDPNHPGFPIGTWAALRETLITVMSLYGIIIWPTILSGCYLIWRRRTGAKLAAKVAIFDEEARLVRIAETERKIAEAKQRGEL